MFEQRWSSIISYFSGFIGQLVDIIDIENSVYGRRLYRHAHDIGPYADRIYGQASELVKNLNEMAGSTENLQEARKVIARFRLADIRSDFKISNLSSKGATAIAP